MKNRDAKRTKAKIFTSGAAGCGKTGPPQPDKRNLEFAWEGISFILNIQSGRLKEHMTRHHSDVQVTEQVPVESKVETKVQDINSSGGHFTHKSPKLLLAEWCQKRNRRKPIYKTLTTYSGKTKHKVVLPDSKNSNNDIVVFLDDGFTADVAEDEVQQLAAVAALFKAAGDCPYHRSLPPQYVPVWNHYHELDQQQKKSQEEAKETSKASTKRLEREFQSIVMSHENQELLKETLLALHPIPNQTTRSLVGPQSHKIVKYLIKEGFPAPSVELAVQEVSKNQPSNLMEAALDWLCFYLDDGKLPAAYAKQSKTQIVNIINSSFTQSENNEEEEDDEVNETEITIPEVKALYQLGYAIEDCIGALEESNNNPHEALVLLYKQLTGLEVQQLEESEKDLESWTEECQVLSAIHDDRFSELNSTSIQLRLELPLEFVNCASTEVWKAHSGNQPDLVFELWGIGISYPSSIPLLSVACQGMKAKFLQFLTVKLSEKSVELVGSPMVHELVDFLQELLNEAQDPEFQLPGHSEPSVRSLIPPPGPQPRPLVSTVESKRPTIRRGIAIFASLNSTEAVKENRLLLSNQERIMDPVNQPPAYKSRMSLPIVQCIKQNPVVVITGMPGCGKSTQVPQFILEDFCFQGQGTMCNIVCTQPRRISAISLATRVSEERNEAVGEVIGFSVRNQKRTSKRTRILYCTTGILLRQLIGDQKLKGVSHVVIDEVHERSIEMDLLLFVLKKLMQKSERQSPKLILMSATTVAADFQSYFASTVGSVPVLNVPGFTYPVREFYLEDVYKALETKRHVSDPSNGWDPLAVEDKNPFPALSVKKLSSKNELTIFDHMEANYEFIENLVAYIIREEHFRGPGFLVRNWTGGGFHSASSTLSYEIGGILVFLPGAMEINKMVRILKTTNKIPEFCKMTVFPLHASLPAHEQNKVFQKLETDVRKIVVTTNVAETSITIPDISIVIDSCLAKEIDFDAQLRISRLETKWISKASGKQRAGRAGRVRPGTCFRLIPDSHWETLIDQTPPEILRTPLESFCLSIASLLGDGHGLSPHLAAECLTPPDPVHVEAAIKTLKETGAIDDDLHLTSLGHHLTKMPMDVHIGKMLIYGALLRSVDSVLTLAGALSYGRPVFFSPPEKRDEAGNFRQEVYSFYQNSKSDHMAIIAAFQAFHQAKLNKVSMIEFCRKRFISMDAMNSILEARVEFASILAELGFVSRRYADEIRTRGIQLDPVFDEFAQNSRFIRGAICAGFYPNLVRVKHPAKKFVPTLSGSKQIDGDAKELKLYDREKGRVFIHPSSVNFKAACFESEWLVYTDIIETGDYETTAFN
eukprot:g5087.t1